MARAGRSLELLVASLERLRALDPDFSIESPAFLTDKDTGRRREIDILLSHRLNNNAKIIAFECKDFKRPVDVPIVEAFSAKVSSLDVDLAVLVSSSGFTAPCVPKAAAKSVFLHTIEQSSKFDWTTVGGIMEDIAVFRQINLVDMNTGLSRSSGFNDFLGKSVSLSDLIDCIFPRLIIDPSKLRCETNNISEGGFPMNNFELNVEGLKEPFPYSGSHPDVLLSISGAFEFHRRFTTFGHFAYRRVRQAEHFMKLDSSLRIDNKITSLVVSEVAPRKVAAFGGGSENRSNARTFRRLVGWDDVYGLLLEVGYRHHFNLTAGSDTLSASKFSSEVDIGLRRWDGTDSWPDLKESGLSTITVADGNEWMKRRTN